MLDPSVFLAGKVWKPPKCWSLGRREDKAAPRPAALLPHAQERIPRREGQSVRRGRGTEGRTRRPTEAGVPGSRGAGQWLRACSARWPSAVAGLGRRR